LRNDNVAGTGGGQVDLHAEKVDLGRLSQSLGLPGPYPDAIGSANLSASTEKQLAKSQVSDYSGFLEVSAASGTLKNFSETDFRSLAATKKFFQLKDAETGDFPFKSFALRADFADGIAELKEATVTGTDHIISVNGVLPYPGFSLALAGSLRQSSQTQEPTTDLNVFIGGTLASAVISPVSIMIKKP
jgi:AsmA protein